MNEEDQERVTRYALERGFSVHELLGDGLHGTVWKVECQDGTYSWVVKMHRYPGAWRREMMCYRRLLEMETVVVSGVNVPSLLGGDETWRTIEMTTVSAPFLLDFGAAWLDERPDFVPGAWEEAEAKAAELFGDKWDRAQQIIRSLEAETGIIMGDVHPGNLRLN